MNDTKIQLVRLESSRVLAQACTALDEQCTKIERVLQDPGLSFESRALLQNDLEAIRRQRDSVNALMLKIIKGITEPMSTLH